MKFPGFREFRNTGDAKFQDIMKYLSVDLIYALRELTNGLTKLSFGDNFQSFNENVVIAAGTELEIRNQLDSIPTSWIVTDNIANAYTIEKGSTEWTLNFIYLKNVGGSQSTAKITFFK